MTNISDEFNYLLSLVIFTFFLLFAYNSGNFLYPLYFEATVSQDEAFYSLKHTCTPGCQLLLRVPILSPGCILLRCSLVLLAPLTIALYRTSQGSKQACEFWGFYNTWQHYTKKNKKHLPL